MYKSLLNPLAPSPLIYTVIVRLAGVCAISLHPGTAGTRPLPQPGFHFLPQPSPDNRPLIIQCQIRLAAFDIIPPIGFHLTFSFVSEQFDPWPWPCAWRSDASGDILSPPPGDVTWTRLSRISPRLILISRVWRIIGFNYVVSCQVRLDAMDLYTKCYRPRLVYGPLLMALIRTRDNPIGVDNPRIIHQRAPDTSICQAQYNETSSANPWDSSKANVCGGG